MQDKRAILIIADSERDSNMFYATGFMAPDPFVYIQNGDETIMLMSDLELDRARSQSKADKVLSFSKYEKIVKKARSIQARPVRPSHPGGHRSGGKSSERGGKKPPKLIDVVIAVLRELKIKKLLVPANFNVGHADYLRKKGFGLKVKGDPFFDSREIKKEYEVEHIIMALRKTEKALDKAIDCIKGSKIKNGFLYTKSGRIITSESVRKIIDVELMKNGCAAKHTIVSCGEQSCEPHNIGSGPLRANESIVFDVFPKDERTGYYADISRTIVKGKASGQLKKMYNAVMSAQNLVFKQVGNGARGNVIHGSVMKHLKSLGFKTGKSKGKMMGFFHGTGHGVGLDVHESPRISRAKNILKTGNVVTVEPGLYYPGIGGVRLEDIILVTDNGCENLTEFPKALITI